MATVRDGTKSVLVIVDVQVAVMQEAWDSAHIISNVVTAVNQARANGVPVIWIQHSDDDLLVGSPEWKLTPEVVPNPDEAVIKKSFASSFEDTDLEKTLTQLQASHIVLAGAATNFCIRSTAYGALDRGYDLTLVSDAHTTGTMELGDKTINAEHIIAELNTTISWIKYPGRTNKAVPTREIDFAELES